MKFSADSLIQYFYFFEFLFSIIVLLDVLIRFKSPLKLKIIFLLVVLSIGTSSFFSFNMTGPDQFIFIIKICKVIAGISVVQIFTNLYFNQLQKIANIHFISAVIFYVFLIFYVQIVGYDTVFPKYNVKSGIVDLREFSYNLPIYINVFVYFYFIAFNLFSLFFIYQILFHFSFKNIYFKRIKKWTVFFFIAILTQLILFPLVIIFKVSNDTKIFISIILTLSVLLIILYRPSFMNKNGSKISFGHLFNRNDFSADIKELDFNFQFFTNLYYKNKSADIAEFANIMGVSKEIMFNYIYFTYAMSLDELINKTRVEYFVEIIKEPKYKNYTVEALAMEVGFNSRQRFYQPFKKYHGGNPSDLIDIF